MSVSILSVGDCRKYPIVHLVGDRDEDMKLSDALDLAEDSDLDVVLLNTGKGKPVCKIMDYSKYLYTKKKNASKPNTKGNIIKDVKVYYGTSAHDMLQKANTARRILKEGYRVRVSAVFKGRENAYIKEGVSKVQSVLNYIADEYTVVAPIQTERNIVSVVLKAK